MVPSRCASTRKSYETKIDKILQDITTELKINYENNLEDPFFTRVFSILSEILENIPEEILFNYTMYTRWTNLSMCIKIFNGTTCGLLPRNMTIEVIKKWHRLHGGVKDRGFRHCDVFITSDKINNSTISELEENVLIEIIDLRK